MRFIVEREGWRIGGKAVRAADVPKATLRRFVERYVDDPRDAAFALWDHLQVRNGHLTAM